MDFMENVKKFETFSHFCLIFSMLTSYEGDWMIKSLSHNEIFVFNINFKVESQSTLNITRKNSMENLMNILKSASEDQKDFQNLIINAYCDYLIHN